MKRKASTILLMVGMAMCMNVWAATAQGPQPPTFWSLTGNSGTTSANFLGTTDNMPLTLVVNGVPALRLLPNAVSPNLIGGYSGNNVTSGVKGAFIGGGGVSGAVNRVTDDHGTVGGGSGNLAGSTNANTTDAPYATVVQVIIVTR